MPFFPLVPTRGTTAAFFIAGFLYLGWASFSDLTYRAVAVLNMQGLSVHQRIRQLFVCLAQKLRDGGTGDLHLLGDLGLRQMLEIVQAQNLVFIGVHHDRVDRSASHGGEMSESWGGADDTLFFGSCHGLLLKFFRCQEGSSFDALIIAWFLTYVNNFFEKI